MTRLVGVTYTDPVTREPRSAYLCAKHEARALPTLKFAAARYSTAHPAAACTACDNEGNTP